MKITDEMVNALRRAVQSRVAMWDAIGELEVLLDVSLDFSAAELDSFVQGHGDDIEEEDVQQLLDSLNQDCGDEVQWDIYGELDDE